MGRNPKLQPNEALAKPHLAGALVVCVQTLTHDPYGAIAYHWPAFWEFEKHLAEESYTQLKELHEAVFELPLDASNMRTISDLDFLLRIYCAGADMVSHATRSVQHLAEMIERRYGTSLQELPAGERIRAAFALFGLNDHAGDLGYQGFNEIVKTRHAVEHPQASNVYQEDPNRWDDVPLAWMISERALKAYERYSSWFELLTSTWLMYCEAHPETRTFTVKRGIESKSPSKKPGKRSPSS